MARKKNVRKRSAAVTGRQVPPKKTLATANQDKGAAVRVAGVLLDEEVVAMTGEEYGEYGFLTFGVPELHQYLDYDGEEVERWRITVTDSEGELLGYLPILDRYLKHWIQLCYNVVYRQEQVRIYTDMMQEVVANRKILLGVLTQASVELRNLLFCRKAIMEEILRAAHSGEDETLDTFDEYIIRDRFDYHFLSQKTLKEKEYWGSDPFSEEMEGPMGECHACIYFWTTTEFL
jgi:hypothetical protein